MEQPPQTPQTPQTPPPASSPPGGDIFDLGVTASRRATADVFDLDAPAAPPSRAAMPARVDDPFADLLAPAPAPAPAAPAAPAVAAAAAVAPVSAVSVTEPLPAEPEEEPEPEDVLFPGLASRDSRRRYLDNLSAEGIFLLDLTPAEPSPAPAPAVFEEPWSPEEPAAAGAEIAEVVEVAEPEPVWAEPEPLPVPPAEDEPTEVWASAQPAPELQPEPAPVFDLGAPAPWTPEPLSVEPAESLPPTLAMPVIPEPGPVATATLGEIYLSQGHLGEAERIFHEVLRREPDNAEAQVGLERLAARRAERRPLESRDLLAGYEPGEEGGETEVRARKAWVLTEYLRRLRGGGQNDVS